MADARDSEPSRRQSAPPHYPGLDGLRAVAVILVFLQHYASGLTRAFGWGWSGVDIFFVLSGFLITGILYDSQHQPHRFRDFYMRRTLRIFPLYYAVWLLFLLLAPVAHWEWNRRWALWPAYVGNYARFLFLHQPGDPYRFSRLTFGEGVRHWFGSPMHLYIGHFWSLCVEEQFYLLWPFVVYRVGRRETLMKICAAAVLLTPLLRWLLTATVPASMLRMELLYRSMPTRVDALLLGGLLALLLRGPERGWLHRWKRWLLAGAVTLFCLGYALATWVLRLPFYGSAYGWVTVWGFTLLDLVAAAVILQTVHPGSWLERWLSLSPLRSLGMISYGFYVYHDLLHDFYAYAAHRLSAAHAAAITIVLAFPASWAIAWLSFRYLESPMLRLKRLFSHQTHRIPAP